MQRWAYRPVTVTIVESVVDTECARPAAPKQAPVPPMHKAQDWMDERCFICNNHVEYLTGVYQTTGCTRHYGVAVMAAMGNTKNTLNLVHLGPCYDAYVAVLRAGGSNCTACLNASARKPQPPKPSLDPPQMAYVSYMAQDAGSLASLLLTGDVKIGV